RSGRSCLTSGSPPEKPICNIPSAAASRITRIHSSVESSALHGGASPCEPALQDVAGAPPSRFPLRMAIGLEQYGQCKGHRYVISASKAYGRGVIMLVRSVYVVAGPQGFPGRRRQACENRRRILQPTPG